MNLSLYSRIKKSVIVWGIGILVFGVLGMLPAAAAPKEDQIDYSVYVSCIDRTAETYTAHFGYVNRGAKSISIDSATLTPPGGAASIPVKFEKGQVDSAFSVSAKNTELITWAVTVDGLTKTATASVDYPSCTVIPAEKKVTICHAAGRVGESSRITITIAWTAAFGQAGHFYENGTPRAGHEQDILGECPTPSVLPTPVSSVAPTYQPSGSPETSIQATSGPLQPTVPLSGTPSIVVTVFQSPLATPTVVQSTAIPEVPNLPRDISLSNLPGRPDAIRIPLKQVENESFSFNTGAVTITSDCEQSTILAYYPALSGTNDIVFAEYSLDAGQTWYQVNKESFGTANGVPSIRIKTRPLPDNLYSIALKVQTTSGAVFVSDAKVYVHKCLSEAYITSYFLQNGFDVSIKNSQNEYYVNRELPVTLYVETMGAVSDISVYSPTSQQSVDLVYNPKEKLWQGNIVSLLDSSTNGTALELVIPSSNSKKILPVIKTIGQEIPKAVSNEGYLYQVYYQIGGAWELLPYKEITGSIPLAAKGTFSLGAGTYFVRVVYPTKQTQISREFTLIDRSIVTLQTRERPNAFLRFAALEVEITQDNSRVTPDIKQLSSIDKRIELKISEVAQASRNYVIVAFWNRWNPRYSEQLPVLKQFSQSSTIQVLMLTDENNREELARLLQNSGSSIKMAVLPSDYFAAETHYVNNDIIVYNREKNTYHIVYDGASLSEVIEEVIK